MGPLAGTPRLYPRETFTVGTGVVGGEAASDDHGSLRVFQRLDPIRCAADHLTQEGRRPDVRQQSRQQTDARDELARPTGLEPVFPP
jgi:hypothetical protein